MDTHTHTSLVSWRAIKHNIGDMATYIQCHVIVHFIKEEVING